MLEQSTQSDPATCMGTYKSLSFELFNEAGEEISHFPVAVKNLTTAGVILELLHLDNGLNPESLKGREGVFTIITPNDCDLIKVPGKILWISNREGDAALTIGLEMLEPLPLAVRHSLEASMSIGAKDMKVLWDYWDEIQESAAHASLTEPAEPAPTVMEPVVMAQENPKVISQGAERPVNNGAMIYWVGFIAIICGISMQFLQSESLVFPGLVVMFLGSLVIALKSMMSMWRVSSPDPAD